MRGTRKGEGPGILLVARERHRHLALPFHFSGARRVGGEECAPYFILLIVQYLLLRIGGGPSAATSAAVMQCWVVKVRLLACGRPIACMRAACSGVIIDAMFGIEVCVVTSQRPTFPCEAAAATGTAKIPMTRHARSFELRINIILSLSRPPADHPDSNCRMATAGCKARRSNTRSAARKYARLPLKRSFECRYRGAPVRRLECRPAK